MPANEPRFWDRLARGYAKSRITDVAGYERTLESVKRHLKSSDEVYEFGCGTGATALRLAPHVAHFLATDFSSEMIAIARERAAAESHANLAFEVGSPDASLPQSAFDAVLGFNVLHLVAERAAVMKAVHAALRPGGLLITKTPCLKEANPLLRLAASLMQAIGQAPYLGWFSAEALEREISAAGFEIVERARHGARKEPRIFLVARKVEPRERSAE